MIFPGANTEFVFAFMENGILMSVPPVGRIYFTNPGATDATVTIVTPLLSGPDRISTVEVVAPGSFGYISVDYDVHMAISGVESKGNHILLCD